MPVNVAIIYEPCNSEMTWLGDERIVFVVSVPDSVVLQNKF